jgi:hypothetical protein
MMPLIHNNNSFKDLTYQLYKHMSDKYEVLKNNKPKFIINNKQQSTHILGPTANYNPMNQTITVYSFGRHPKDMLRSFAHEVIHHVQNCEGRLTNSSTHEGYALDDPNMSEIEREAYEQGNMCFREFEDLYKRQNPINESIKALNELQGRTLHVYDFDDTLVKTKADVIVNRPDGSSYTLDSHAFATHKLAPGESYNFANFDKIIKGSEPLIQNIKQIQRSLANPNIKTTILTARRVAFPIMKHLRDKYGIDTYVIAVGSSDPEVKADWIENQVKKGYTDIKFMDDSVKNLNAVGRRLANSNVNLTLINSLTGQETKMPAKATVNEEEIVPVGTAGETIQDPKLQQKLSKNLKQVLMKVSSSVRSKLTSLLSDDSVTSALKSADQRASIISAIAIAFGINDKEFAQIVSKIKTNLKATDSETKPGVGGEQEPVKSI